MILRFEEGIVTKTRGIGNAIFGSGEIEHIAIAREPPVLQSGDVKSQISAILISDARSLGKSIT